MKMSQQVEDECNCKQSDSINSQKVEGLLDWLREMGSTGLDEVEIRPSEECNGSLGCFTKVAREKGDTLVRIPKKCILGLGSALKNEKILRLKELAERQVNESAKVNESADKKQDNGKKSKKTKGVKENSSNQVLSNEFLLWVYESECLLEGKSEWSAYLESLPSESPTVNSWEKSLLESISKTNLGSAVTMESVEFQRQLEVLQNIQLIEPSLFHKDVSQHLEWSRGNYLSRRFVGKLAFNGEGKGLEQYGGKMGCMVPFFDLLNHKNEHVVNFQHDEESVWYVCEYALKAGDEVFNNYCRASNEELLFTYGFSLPNNPLDFLPIKLMACDKKGKPKELGVFKIARKAQGGIPKELLQAFIGQEDVSEIFPEEIEMLLKMVKQKSDIITDILPYFSGKQQQPEDIKIQYLLHYLNGQKEIIEEAIVELQNMKFDTNTDLGYEYH